MIFLRHGVDDWVHLVHVGANPLDPHAEHRHEYNHRGKATILGHNPGENLRLVLRVGESARALLPDQHVRPDDAAHCEDRKDDTSCHQTGQWYSFSHFFNFSLHSTED